MVLLFKAEQNLVKLVNFQASNLIMKHLSELKLCGMQSTGLLFTSVIYSIIKTAVDFSASEVVPSAVRNGNGYEIFSGLLIFPRWALNKTTCSVI